MDVGVLERVGVINIFKGRERERMIVIYER